MQLIFTKLLLESNFEAEAYYYVKINAPMKCLTLNRLKSLMIGCETNIQTNKDRATKILNAFVSVCLSVCLSVNPVKMWSCKNIPNQCISQENTKKRRINEETEKIVFLYICIFSSRVFHKSLDSRFMIFPADFVLLHNASRSNYRIMFESVFLRPTIRFLQSIYLRSV